MTPKKFILPSVIAIAVIAVIAVVITVLNKSNEPRLITVNNFGGSVTIQRGETLDAFKGLEIVSEDSVTVGEDSSVELLADSDKHISAEENTAFIIHSTGNEKSGNITVDLLYGKALFTIDNKLNEESSFEVTTPNAALSVQGTSFSVVYDTTEKTTTVEVFKGIVVAVSDKGEMLLGKGDAVTIYTSDSEVETDKNAPIEGNGENALPDDGTDKDTTKPAASTTAASDAVTTTAIADADVPENTTAETTATTKDNATTKTTTKATTEKTTKYDETLVLQMTYDHYGSDDDSIGDFYLQGKWKDYAKVFDMQGGEIDICRQGAGGKYIGDPECLNPVVETLSDVAAAHSDELNKKVYEKYKKNGFKKMKSVSPDYYEMNVKVSDMNVTNWFPESVEIIDDAEIYRIVIKKVDLSFSASGSTDEDDVIDTDGLPTAKAPDGDKIYVTTHSHIFKFYVDIKKG